MSAETRAPGWPERLLRPFAEVRAGEALTALVLATTILLILTSYYLLKVIREPLILLSGGAEVKAYAAAGQALLLIPVLRAHGAIARRVSRLKLIAIILLFVASNLDRLRGAAARTRPHRARPSTCGSEPSTTCWSPPSGASPTTSTRPSRASGCSPSSASAARSGRSPAPPWPAFSSSTSLRCI